MVRFGRENKIHGKPFYVYMFFIFLSLGTSYGDTNVLTNPGFESGTTGWAGRSCSISTVTSPVHSSSYSGRAYNRTAHWQGIKQSMLARLVLMIWQNWPSGGFGLVKMAVFRKILLAMELSI